MPHNLEHRFNNNGSSFGPGDRPPGGGGDPGRDPNTGFKNKYDSRGRKYEIQPTSDTGGKPGNGRPTVYKP